MASTNLERSANPAVQVSQEISNRTVMHFASQPERCPLMPANSLNVLLLLAAVCVAFPARAEQITLRCVGTTDFSVLMDPEKKAVSDFGYTSDGVETKIFSETTINAQQRTKVPAAAGFPAIDMLLVLDIDRVSGKFGLLWIASQHINKKSVPELSKTEQGTCQVMQRRF